METLEKIERTEKDILTLLVKFHSILKPYIYILSALMFGIVGAYLFGVIMPILQNAPQPSWLVAIFGWSFILLITYWIMRIASLAAQEFSNRSKEKNK